MTQHFFCNAMPIGEIEGEVAIVRFVMESPLDHGGPTGIDGVFTPHAARAAAEAAGFRSCLRCRSSSKGEGAIGFALGVSTRGAGRVAAAAEAEGLDAFGNLPDLLSGVTPWVGGVRFQIVDPAINDP